MAKSFIDFILECEGPGGGAILRDYMATRNLSDLKKFFASRGGYTISDPDLEKLWEAKDKGQYFCIDYEYINGPGKSY